MIQREKMLAVFVAILTVAGTAIAQVDCDAGATIADAVASANPGDTIQVSGTCNESVITITTDRLTLDGQGSTVIDGGGAGGPIGPDFSGVLTVNGARDVTITGFTIQNGGVDGLVGMRGATLTIRNVTVQDHTRSGMILSDNTIADISDVTAQRNGVFGIRLFGGARVTFRGTINATENGQTNATAGIGIATNSTARMHEATIQANNNLGDGIGIANNGVLAIVSPFGDGNMIMVNGNGNDGIHMFNNSTFQVAGNTSVNASGNGRSGVWLIGNAAVVNLPPGTFLLENNTTGLELDVQGAAFFIGGLTIRNNTTGILASGADTLTVVSVPPSPSDLTGNTTDVALSFGTRSTFNDVPIATITCDATVLSRGTTVCP